MVQSQHLNQAFQSAAFPSTSGSTFSHLVGPNGSPHSQMLDAAITSRNEYPRYPTSEVYSKPASYMPKDDGEPKVTSEDVIEPRVEDSFVKPSAEDYNKTLPNEFSKVPTDYSKVAMDPTTSANWSPTHSSLNMSLSGISSEYKYMNEHYTFPNIADPLNQHNYPNPSNAASKYWI